MKKDPRPDATGSRAFGRDLKKAYTKKRSSLRTPGARGTTQAIMDKAFGATKTFGAPMRPATPAMNALARSKKAKTSKKKVSNVVQKRCKACKTAHKPGKHAQA